MKDKHKYSDDWGLRDADQAPREKTKDLGRTNGPKTCSFWERERSWNCAVPNCHFPRGKQPASCYRSEFLSSQFPEKEGGRASGLGSENGQPSIERKRIRSTSQERSTWSPWSMRPEWLFRLARCVIFEHANLLRKAARISRDEESGFPRKFR
jgi:hypothetical protein